MDLLKHGRDGKEGERNLGEGKERRALWRLACREGWQVGMNRVRQSRGKGWTDSR